jgi:hypothetical protein
MDRYRNLSGASGVVCYDIAGDAITVEFQDGSAYLYNAMKPGLRVVQQMQQLARAGRGLNSFINTRVKTNYARKLR